MQETQIQLQSSLGSQITLYWDTQLSLYKSSTLSQSALPNNTFYDLMPFTEILQGFEVPSIAKTSQPASISNPALQEEVRLPSVNINNLIGHHRVHLGLESR